MKQPQNQAPAEFFLAGLLGQLDQPAIVVDESLRTVYFNEPSKALRWPGPGRPASWSFHDLVSQPRAGHSAECFRRVLESGVPEDLAVDFLVAGEVRSCRVRIVPVQDPTDGRSYLIGLVSCPDLGAGWQGDGDHLLAVRPLPPVLGELFAYLDTCPYCICIKNPSKFLWVNRTFAHTFGREPRDFVGKAVEEAIFGSRTVSRWRAEDEQVLRTRVPLRNLERSFDLGDSRPRRFRVDKVPYIDRRGRAVAVVAVGIENPDPEAGAAPPDLDLFRLKTAELTLEGLEDLAAALESQLGQEDENAMAEEESVQAVAKIVSPVLKKLKNTGLGADELTYVELIEKNINLLADPLTARISAPIYRLSPTEVRVAQLVRDGKTTKEIAAMLNLSSSTIHTHRQRIREKLGLKNNAASLRSHLHSL